MLQQFPYFIDVKIRSLRLEPVNAPYMCNNIDTIVDLIDNI